VVASRGAHPEMMVPTASYGSIALAMERTWALDTLNV
jgi:hypothetical protein